MPGVPGGGPRLLHAGRRALGHRVEVRGVPGGVDLVHVRGQQHMVLEDPAPRHLDARGVPGDQRPASVQVRRQPFHP